MRPPFQEVIHALELTRLPVTSVDAPSSWGIDAGPPAHGPGARLMPAALVSLTAPKPLVRYLAPPARHFLGGR